MSKKTTLEEIALIIKLSPTHSQREIASKINKSQVTVGKILKKNGLSFKKSRLNMSKINLDVNYFFNIDTPEKSYWLGYICADGSINRYNNKLTLVSKDKEVCEKFKTAIKSQHKISSYTYFDTRTNRNYSSFSIQITNELFVTNLIKHGVTNEKSKRLFFPKIKQEFYPFFIGGLYDGDGSIAKRKSGNYVVSLISTKELLLFLQNFLIVKLNLNKTKIQKVADKMNVYKLFIQNKKDINNLLSYIYAENYGFFLQRKLNSFKVLKKTL